VTSAFYSAQRSGLLKVVEGGRGGGGDEHTYRNEDISARRGLNTELRANALVQMLAVLLDPV
jgi:hypothetical protein